jgi:hypothetical protein
MAGFACYLATWREETFERLERLESSVLAIFYLEPNLEPLKHR